MSSIGEILRCAREEQGRTTSEIAQELCILQRYVAAIESGDIKNLPGLFFYKSFVRQYARLLAIDEKPILTQLEAVSAVAEPAPRHEIRVLDPLVEQGNRRSVPDIPMSWSVAGLAAVVVLCSGFYAWWTRVPVRTEAKQTVQVVNSPAPPLTPAQAVNDTPTTTAPSAAPEAQPAPEAPTAPETNASADTAPTVEVRPIASSDSAVLGGIVLKLSATEATWLSVSSGGREVFSGVLQPSESKTLSGLDMGTMKVGNAAGISVHLNGKAMGPLGQRGQVLTIHFTAEEFEIVPPKTQL